MKRLAKLASDFNDRLTANPGTLPKKLFVLELTDGPGFHLDGKTDQLISGPTDREPDCIITTSAEALEALLEDPSSATKLVLSGKLKFDNAGAVIQLAAALKNLL